MSWAGDRPRPEFMEQLKEVPVHVHCIANYRVSAFFYRYRRDVLGVGEATARADAERAAVLAVSMWCELPI
jgi:hypothetical protein